MARSEGTEGGSIAIDRIAEVLAPYLGPHMTKVSINMYLKQLGISEVPSPAQLEALIDRLAPGLNAFVGDERASVLAAEMRRAAKGD